MTDKGWALDPSPDNIGLKEQHTTFYPLHGKGWDGDGVTQDDVNGDERRRTRAFSFCIPHIQLALCGSMQSVAYLMCPKETTLPQVIKLLESVEFIDTPASACSSAKATRRPPVISDPQRISTEPFNCIDAGGWYWTAGSASNGFKTINSVIPEGAILDQTVFDVSRAINGLNRSGEPNGLHDRTAYTQRISRIVMDL